MFGRFTDFLLNHKLLFLCTLIFSYLVGSINLSIIVSKILKCDIRNLGSKNAGFSNALRTLGPVAGIITFLGDFLKGIVAAGISKIILTKFTQNSEIILISLHLMIFACFMGHLYPCYFGFKGGKGILTAWAMSLILNWKLFIIMISIFITVVLIFKIVSLGSITVGIFYPIVTFILYFNQKHVLLFVTFSSILIGAILVLRHKSNIKRLLCGQESKISLF